MGAQIPGVIGDVNATWLKSELGWDVDSMDVQQIGAGIGVSSALYRLKLRGANCPSSVIVKLPALDEAAVFTSTMLRMYIREANFFGSLCNEMPIGVPVAYLALELGRVVVIVYLVLTTLLWSPWSPVKTQINESQGYAQLDQRLPSVITDLRERADELLTN